MDTINFIGRDRELGHMNNLYNQNGFKFLVVYGRRRVGKSTLIDKFVQIDNKPAITYMAIEQNEKSNLKAFSEAILSRYPRAANYLTNFDDFDKAFDYIIDQAGETKLVISIDEYPYLALSNPSISSIFQRIIDTKLKKTNITLILCGSSMSFMENQVLGYKSPLYGRRTAQYRILPLDYLETAEYFGDISLTDKALAYGISGGVPLYMEMLKGVGTLEENIIRQIFCQNGMLFEEPSNLLKQELREPAIYNAIITAIAEGATRLSEIATKAGEEITLCSKYIAKLVSLHIVIKEKPVGDGNKKNSIYRLSDNLFRFWYRFVPMNKINIEYSSATQIYELKVKPHLSNYMGGIFEDICKQYLLMQNAQQNLPFVFDDIGRWWGGSSATKQQVEIDLIAYTKDKAIFCECKWTNEKVDLPVFNSLVSKAGEFTQYPQKHYYLFAKSGFTKTVLDIAETRNDIKLVSLDNIYNTKI